MKTPFTGLTMLTKQGTEPLALKERVQLSASPRPARAFDMIQTEKWSSRI